MFTKLLELMGPTSMEETVGGVFSYTVGDLVPAPLSGEPSERELVMDMEYVLD